MYYAFQHGNHTFLRREGQGDTIRVLSHPTQFVLVQKHLRTAPVEVCSMNHFGSIDFADPERALEAMTQVKAVPEHGGWRTPSDAELSALYVSTFGHLPLPALTGLLEPLKPHILAHPAIRSGVCFAFGGDIPIALVTLLMYMYDIRRFVDPAKIGGSGHLKSYFKLNSPSLLLRFLHEQRATSATTRPALAFLGWYSNPYQFLDPSQWKGIPHAFLFRDTCEKADEYQRSCDKDEANKLALWRSTIRFMVFLRMLWNAGIDDKPFDPARFFHREDETESFLSFINKSDFRLDNFDLTH